MPNLKHIIIVSGPQGSGKSTQAENLAQYLGYGLFEAGAALRAMVEQRSPGHEEVSQAMAQGVLVPDHYVNELFMKFIGSLKEGSGIVTDGFPRRLDQWNIISEAAKSHQASIIGVYITLTEAVALERIKNRVVVQNGRAQKRLDDTAATLKQRFAVYHHETVPVLNYIREHHRLVEIDGSPSIEVVSQNIKSQIDKLLNGHPGV